MHNYLQDSSDMRKTTSWLMTDIVAIQEVFDMSWTGATVEGAAPKPLDVAGYLVVFQDGVVLHRTTMQMKRQVPYFHGLLTI